MSSSSKPANGGGVPPGSPNLDPISDRKMLFFTPVFRPGLRENPYPFSDLAFKIMSSYLDENSNKNNFLKSITNSHISLSFLLIWN